MKKKAISILTFMLCILNLNFFVYADQTVTIELDPGHGGKDTGASCRWDETDVEEKELNLKIAMYLKEELEQYENVKVCMTRTDDSFISLDDRTEKARADQADVLISIHNNAVGDIADYDNGSNVLTAQGNYRKQLAGEEDKLGSQILEELAQTGLQNQGLMHRISENHTMYSNGKLSDYYHIVRKGIQDNYLAIIIEHAFIDYEKDYQEHLKNNESLRELAVADANGIARYFQLNKAGEEALPIIRNISEKIILVKDSDGKKTEISSKVFYEQKEKSQTETMIHKTEEENTEQSFIGKIKEWILNLFIKR